MSRFLVVWRFLLLYAFPLVMLSLAYSGTVRSESTQARTGNAFRIAELLPEMVVIPGGSFRMGDLSDAGRASERPAHLVTISSFKLARHEVTFAQWDACVAEGSCGGWWRSDVGWGRRNRPVFNISWNEVQAYIDWLNARAEGNYRLPTEAEWEYAARAGSTTKYHVGDDESQLCLYANHADLSTDYEWRNLACSDGVGKRTAEVGQFQPNNFGLYDMHGNVWEWTQDCWHENYTGAPGDGSAWANGGDCKQRVVRGGAWYSFPIGLRSAARKPLSRWVRFNGGVGFRLAQDM